METKKIVMGVISVAVAIIVLMSMIPIFTDAGASEDTFTNTGVYRMKALEDGDTWTMADGKWTYGDVPQTVTLVGGANALLGDNWCVRSNGQVRGETISGNLYTGLIAVTGEDSISITGSGVGGSSTQSIPGYGMDMSGDYLLTQYNANAPYLKGDSKIYGTGISNVDNVDMIVHVEATVDDGATFTIKSNRNGVTISDVVLSNTKVNYTPVDGYKDLYVVQSVTTDIAYNGTTGGETTAHTGSISFSSYVVPYQVTAERSAHASPVESTLIGLIPLLMMVGIMLTAIGLFITKYRKN